MLQQTQSPQPRPLRLTPIIVVAMLLLALVPRFIWLADKPPSHDEAMFGYYAWVGNGGAEEKPAPDVHYIHQAILHGPVQMIGIAWFFRMFGDSEASARAFIACCSLVMLAAGIYVTPRRWRWWFAPLWLTCPIALYYSRYLHEELIFNGAYLVGMLGFARGMKRSWTGILGLWLALGALLLLVARLSLVQSGQTPEGLVQGLFGGAGGLGSRVIASLMFAGAVGCGFFAVKRTLPAAGWAIVAAVGLFFPLAVKESCLFVYAAGFTFMIAWVVIQYCWRGPAIGLSWLPRRVPVRGGGRKVATPAGVKVPRAQARQKAAPQGRGRTYMHKTFEEVVETQPGTAGADGGELQSGEIASEKMAVRRAGKPLLWPVVLALWAAGLVLGAGFVCWVYGHARPDWVHGWGPVKLFNGALKSMLESWDYWLGQHKENRMGGPVDYYFPIMALYELPILLLLLLGIVWDASRRARRAAFYIIVFSLWLITYWIYTAVLASGLNSDPTLSAANANIFIKLIRFLHLNPEVSNGNSAQPQFLLLGSIIIPILTWSILCLKQHRPLAAWMGWWAACSMFQYSTAGEKVPWLTVNIIVPFYMTLAHVWAPYLKRIGPKFRYGLAAFAGLALLITLRNDYYLVKGYTPGVTGPQRHSADPRERIVYNHTSAEFDEYCKKWLATWTTLQDRIPLKERKVQLLGAPAWPGIWYFRHCNAITGVGPLTTIDPTYDLIFGEDTDINPVLKDLELTQWQPKKFSLRDHWLVSTFPTAAYPDPDSNPPLPMNNLAAFWNYYWTRQVWPPRPGHYPVSALEPTKPRI